MPLLAIPAFVVAIDPAGIPTKDQAGCGVGDGLIGIERNGAKVKPLVGPLLGIAGETVGQRADGGIERNGGSDVDGDGIARTAGGFGLQQHPRIQDGLRPRGGCAEIDQRDSEVLVGRARCDGRCAHRPVARARKDRRGGGFGAAHWRANLNLDGGIGCPTVAAREDDLAIAGAGLRFAKDGRQRRCSAGGTECGVDQGVVGIGQEALDAHYCSLR